MKKIFCKRNLMIGGIFLCVLTCLILCIFLGNTNGFHNSPKQYIVIYCLVAIFVSLAMFNCITKILDKKTKYLFIALFCMLISWLTIKIFDKVAIFDDNTDYIWYLLYIPLLFVPNLWFLINNEIYLKNRKTKLILSIITLTISALLFILVLTNDLHQLVFLFPKGSTGAHYSNYKYNFGYFMIYAFIFTEILTTITLFYIFSVKRANAKQKIFPSIIIAMIVIYSVLYITIDINIPILLDMTIVYVFLSALLAYVSFKCGLIKNSGNYLDFFENCVCPLAIKSLDGKVVYQNTNFKQFRNDPDFVLEEQSTTNSTLMILEDIGKIKELQTQLKKKIKELKYSIKILQRKQEISQKEEQLKQRVLLFNKVEKQVENKKIELEKLLSMLPSKITNENKEQTKNCLNQIKLVIGYLKRKTSLILQAEQKANISKDEINLIFKESFNDLKYFGINAGIGITENEIPTNVIMKIYDIYNEFICKLNAENIDIWITLKKQDVWIFQLLFDNFKLEKINLSLPEEYGFEYGVEYFEDCTNVYFKGGEL